VHVLQAFKSKKKYVYPDPDTLAAAGMCLKRPQLSAAYGRLLTEMKNGPTFCQIPDARLRDDGKAQNAEKIMRKLGRNATRAFKGQVIPHTYCRKRLCPPLHCQLLFCVQDSLFSNNVKKYAISYIPRIQIFNP
jgi:hypothetical protein